MNGLFTILLVCFAISFVFKGWTYALLFAVVALIYTWFFNPIWKRKLKSWFSIPSNKVKKIKDEFSEDKRKKQINKVFKNMNKK